MKSKIFETPVGNLYGVSDENYLYILDFVDTSDFIDDSIEKGDTVVFSELQKELDGYFDKRLKDFSIPYILKGTDFQKDVWRALAKIQYGTTISYAELSNNIGRPRSFRAVANAVGANKLVILLPCHRVTGSNGYVGGYGGGIRKKEWLLNFEK